MSFTFICPSKAETACTGFLGGAERTLRGKHYRVEIYPSGLRLLKDGEQLRSWDDLPKLVQKDVIAAKKIVESAPKQP